MIIITILVGSLLTLLFLLLKTKLKYPGVPLCPGRWPILGHIPLLLGDNVKLYKTIEKISFNAIENGGCTAIKLGMFLYYYFITDPDDVSTILNAATEKHYIYSFSDAWLGNGLLTAPPHIWQVRKKLLYPMFQQKNLNKFMTVFNYQGKRLVHQFSDQIGKGPFDHEHNALIISLETICQTALGSNVGEEMARNNEFIVAMEALMNSIVDRFKTFWLHFKPIFELSSVKKDHDENLKVVQNLAKKLITKRRSQLNDDTKEIQEEFQPFVDTIFKISSENEHFNEKDIIDEVNTLLIAGYDTTANTLVFCLMLLGRHQDVQDKVFQELQDVFGDTERDVDKDDLRKLVYLEAVLNETARLYTVTPVIARKLNTDLKLKNYTFPAGSDCIISLYGLHRNPEWGEDACEFNPDRWMSPETLPKNPNLFAPFGGGKRYCAGKTYAMMSMKTTLVHVLRHYRIKSDLNNLVLQMMILLKPASGHHISLEPRKAPINTVS